VEASLKDSIRPSINNNTSSDHWETWGHTVQGTYIATGNVQYSTYTVSRYRCILPLTCDRDINVYVHKVPYMLFSFILMYIGSQGYQPCEWLKGLQGVDAHLKICWLSIPLNVLQSGGLQSTSWPPAPGLASCGWPGWLCWATRPLLCGARSDGSGRACQGARLLSPRRRRRVRRRTSPFPPGPTARVPGTWRWSRSTLPLRTGARSWRAEHQHTLGQGRTSRNRNRYSFP